MSDGAKFIMLPYAVYDSPEFAALSPTDLAVLLLLIRKHNGHNNGSIALGVREAAAKCGLGKSSAQRALAHLQQSRLVAITYKGHLVPEVGRPDSATKWRLNFVTENSKTSTKRKARIIKFPRPRPTKDTSGRPTRGTSSD
jgi:hypothetical protein